MSENAMNQRGFTLISMLISLSILGVLGSSAGVAISQSIRISEKGHNQLTALHEIENAAFWIGRDGRMAASTDMVDDALPTSSVTLQWTDRFGLDSVDHASTYQLVGTEIRRTYDGVTRTLARNISSLDFSLSGQLITVSIVSTPQGSAGVTKQGTYLINLRPSG